ncbi:OmpL47-type beta-barrel domain-containing protein [Cohnella zeiphila]|uniref:Carbohydrate binding domain-containing protein n=1 Tax=Cohnella zeiphila TaxID=2761120 RepID=A0A7X0SR93_9BACL|nr:carbohydrate binding domain-containing protein [Cohnella zeiphila]MBB6732423.1 carbohydrate binding domain-containing protein [Cohnella zeiphila]
MLASAILLSAFVFVSEPAHASPTVYYVAKNGNDSWNGTSADFVSGSTGPFLTIQKCASIAAPGDTCAVRGGVYRETVKPVGSGTSAAPITFQPYQNESVTIDGTDIVTSEWTLKSGSTDIYQTNIALNPALFANQLFVDGSMMTQARWPNTSGQLMYPTLAVAEANTTTTGTATETVYDSHLPNLDLTGTKVWILGGAQFTAHSGTISASSPGSFTFNQPMAGCASLCSKEGSRYFLFGSLSFLDAPSEFQYESDTQTLYLQTPDNTDPSTHTVQVKQRQYGFDLAGRSFIQIKGFRLFATTIFTNGDSKNNVIDGIDAEYPSHYMEIPDDPKNGPYGSHNYDTGIIMDGLTNTLKNSTIAYSAGNGVAQIGRFNVITNNLIHDVDYSGTYNAPIRFLGAGVDVTATYNTMYNTGRDGMIGGGLRNRVAYNNIYNYGLIDKDLGGFYTCCGATLGTGSSIDHNWVHDDKSGGGVGIYIDNGASQFLIHHNVSWNNNGAGMILNGLTTGKSQGNKVYNNTLAGGQTKSIASAGVVDSTGTVVQNNIFRGPTDPMPGGSMFLNNLAPPANPLFVDETASNFHLQSGSAAINAGAVIPGITDGYSGSAPDQGAYEFGQYDWVPGCNFNGYGSSCSPTNKVSNPGFEQGTTGWHAAGGSITTAADSHSGTSSLKVYNRTGASNSARQNLPIENGKTYTFSAYTKLGSGTDSAYLVLEVVSGGQTSWIQLASNPINSTSWTQLSRTYTFNLAAPITAANLYVQTGTSLADLYVDDMFADEFKTRLTPPGLYVDKTKLNTAITTAQTLYDGAVEGSEPGQYPAGSKAELLSAIQEAQTVAADANATEDAVDGAVRTLNTEITAFRSSRNLDATVIVDVNDMIADQAGWDADPGSLSFSDDSLVFTPTTARTVFGYTGAKIKHNEILQFKAKLDTSNGLQAFGIRATNTNKVAWDSNSQYLIVVKSGTVEVQKWYGGNLIVESIPNTFLQSGIWHTVQLGAIDTHEGVQVIMNVDGTEVVNWTDTNNPIQDEGYFEVYGSTTQSPIAIGSIESPDTTAPVTTAALSPAQPDGQNGWYVQPVTVTLTAEDDKSGAAGSEYSLDNGTTWQPYESPFTVDQEGQNVIRYRSTDAAGNVEEAQTLTLPIDRTAPTAEVGYSAVTPTSGSVVATITPSENVTVTNNGGSDSYTFQSNGSFTFEFVDQAGNPGTATATVSNIAAKSAGVPGKPILSSDNGYDTGILDGSYTVTMNMWWGNNGDVYKLYENDVLIDTQTLTDDSPNAQSAVKSVSGRKNGIYRYDAELTNAYGTTRSDDLTVNVTQAEPTQPVLSNDNWDGDGNFNVNMNMWWGTNGATYRLYENGVLIDTQTLAGQTPQAQSAATAIVDRPAGVYEYRCEIENEAGSTSSEVMVVHVNESAAPQQM